MSNASSSSSEESERRKHLREMISAAANAARAGRSTVKDRLGVVPHGLPPNLIAGYELLGEVHRGGQGVVYRGVQDSTKRIVAIKILKEGPFAGETDRLRFDREVSILAQLNHQSIIGILDRGRVAGSDYLVMDYVHGLPLDRYAQEHAPDLRSRLQLFAAICDAVNAAHLRGVIHRDLKPGNILVNDAGEPRILDFGLAKLSADDSGNAPFATRTGQFIGSLPWASPEQARGRHAEVDVRSDVYSLGVVLYQLVTDRFPYKTVGELNEVLNAIQNTPPTSPRSLVRAINDDLETIILKTLAKEPSRRYQSVGELARDIRHYLNDEPIEARRDSALYMLRKTVRRHRVALAVACGFAAVLVVSTIVSWNQFARARDAALVAKIAENTAREQEEFARLQARRAERINDFVKTALQSANPNEGGNQGMLVADAMMQALKGIDEGAFDDDLETKAGLLATISTILNRNGRPKEALALAEQSLDIHKKIHVGDHIDVARGMNDLAVVMQEFGRHEDALSLYEQSLAMHRRLNQGDSPDIASGLNNLATALGGAGRTEEAVPLLVEALEMSQRLHPGDHAEVALCLNNLAFAKFKLGRKDEARQLFQQALDMRRRLFKGDHPDVALTLGNLAFVTGAIDGPAAAEPIQQQTLEMQQRLFKGDHPIIASTLSNLAATRKSMGRLPEAESLYSQALEMRRRLFGNDHPELATSINNLATALEALNNPEQAEPLRREAVGLLKRLHEGDHPSLALAMARHAECLTKLQRNDEARTIAQQAADMAARILPEQNATRKKCDQVLAMLKTTTSGKTDDGD